MRLRITSFSFILILLCLNSCRKDTYMEDIETVVSPPNVFLLINLTGVIHNAQGTALEGAEVLVGNLRAVTDKNGVYILRSVRVPVEVVSIQVKAGGMEPQLRLIVPEKGKWYRNDFTLIPKSLTTNFNSAEGAAISLDHQSSLEIPGNAIQLYSGEKYTGEVKVYASYQLADDAAFYTIEPGLFLSGEGIPNKKLILNQGILKIRLESPSGYSLRLNPDFSARLITPVHSSWISQSDDQVKVWYLDENKGIWKPGSDVTRNGSLYEITLKQLHCITFGKEVESVWLSGSLKSEDDIPFDHGNLSISSELIYTQKIIPGGDGRFRVMVPKNSNVELKLRNHCNDVIFEKELNIQSTDLELNNLHIIHSDNQIPFLGKIGFCNGKTGYAYLVLQSGMDKRILFPSGSNNFSSIWDICQAENSVLLTIVNSTVNRSSQTVTMPGGMESYHFDQIELCDEIDILPSYAYVSVKDQLFFSSISEASLTKKVVVSTHEYELNVSSFLNNRTMELNMQFLDPKYGASLNPRMGFQLNDGTGNLVACNLPVTSCDLEVNIWEYQGIGSRLKGNFKGSDRPDSDFEFDGSFNMRVVEKK